MAMVAFRRDWRSDRWRYGMEPRKAARLAATPCPSCGKTELRQERVVLAEATLEAAGSGEHRTICGACGHTTAEPFVISKKSSPKDDAPKFSGGKSDGDGASGKW